MVWAVWSENFHGEVPFFQSSCGILGHQINAEGRHPLADKLQVITQGRAPRNMTELRFFLGLVNYYAIFIPTYLLFSSVSLEPAPAKRDLLRLDEGLSTCVWDSQKQARIHPSTNALQFQFAHCLGRWRICLWGQSGNITHHPWWTATSYCVCFMSADQEWAKLLISGKRSVIPHFWNQKVPSVSLRKKVHVGDGPQASDSHIWIQEGSASHGCSKTAEMGNTVSFIQLQNQIWTDLRARQCRRNFQVAFGRRRAGRPLCRTRNLHGVSDRESPSYCCSFEEIHWHRLSVKQSSSLYENRVASISRHRTATLLVWELSQKINHFYSSLLRRRFFVTMMSKIVL